jgi:dTDP-4-amino-4,6-dideoxygalactose transaminase
MKIFTDMTPNMGKKETLTALKSFFTSSNKDFANLAKSIEKQYRMNATFFDSGRSALFKILEAIPRDNRTEVIVQSYTCVVVVNAIKAAGYKPVYVDVDENGINMSVTDFKKQINKQTRAVIVQHTFGFPDMIDEIKTIAKEYKIFLIEDLAHSVTTTYKKELVGTFGDAAFISFGSGKLLSASRGGVALTRKLKLGVEDILPMEDVWKHLFKIVFFWLAKPFYYVFKAGKIKLYVFSKLGFFPKVITKEEKNGEAPEVFNFSPKLASVAYLQWKNRQKNKNHRQKIAKVYNSNLQETVELLPYNSDSSYMRFPIFVDDPENLYSFMKKHHVLLGAEWSGSVIVPKTIDLRKTKYKGQSKNAEKTALRILNLPTDRHITLEKAKSISDLVKKYYEL